jgi:hypothetical protein
MLLINPPPALAISLACSADADVWFSGRMPSVLSRVFVPVPAMRRLWPTNVRSTQFAVFGARSATPIFCSRHWLKVKRIHTSPVATEMIYFQTFTDRAER